MGSSRRRSVARPKAKGETVPVQLPLGLDAYVRRQAMLRGVSPGAWIAWFLASRLHVGDGSPRQWHKYDR